MYSVVLIESDIYALVQYQKWFDYWWVRTVVVTKTQLFWDHKII